MLQVRRKGTFITAANTAEENSGQLENSRILQPRL
jgi:hypothetical protein